MKLSEKDREWLKANAPKSVQDCIAWMEFGLTVIERAAAVALGKIELEDKKDE